MLSLQVRSVSQVRRARRSPLHLLGFCHRLHARRLDFHRYRPRTRLSRQLPSALYVNVNCLDDLLTSATRISGTKAALASDQGQKRMVRLSQLQHTASTDATSFSRTNLLCRRILLARLPPLVSRSPAQPPALARQPASPSTASAASVRGQFSRWRRRSGARGAGRASRIPGPGQQADGRVLQLLVHRGHPRALLSLNGPLPLF